MVSPRAHSRHPYVRCTADYAAAAVAVRRVSFSDSECHFAGRIISRSIIYVLQTSHVRSDYGVQAVYFSQRRRFQYYFMTPALSRSSTRCTEKSPSDAMTAARRAVMFARNDIWLTPSDASVLTRATSYRVPDPYPRIRRRRPPHRLQRSILNFWVLF